MKTIQSIARAGLLCVACVLGVTAAWASADNLTGTYENHVYDGGGKNDWHYVTVTKIDASRVKWTNRANVSWTLTLTPDKNTLAVGPNPYSSTGYSTAKVIWGNDGTVSQIIGPHNEPFQRNRVTYKTCSENFSQCKMEHVTIYQNGTSRQESRCRKQIVTVYQNGTSRTESRDEMVLATRYYNCPSNVPCSKTCNR